MGCGNIKTACNGLVVPPLGHCDALGHKTLGDSLLDGDALSGDDGGGGGASIIALYKDKFWFLGIGSKGRYTGKRQSKKQ